jgi:tetratricopeptide (TPR) repeat protein
MTAIPVEKLRESGMDARRAGDLKKAAAAFAEIVAQSPADFDALYHLGQAQAALGRHKAAVATFTDAIALDDDSTDSYASRGLSLAALGRYGEALADFTHVAERRPDLPSAFNNIGNSLRDLGRPEEAVAAYDRALALREDHAGSYVNRSVALSDLGRFAEALSDCDRAIVLQPDDAKAHKERGVALTGLRRFEEALASYQTAIGLDPDFADAHWNGALARLMLGDFANGWREYEWRWKKSGVRPIARVFSQPRWTGTEDLFRKTVLLHGEQGLGDMIQFCRYAVLLASRGARVIVEVPKPLVELLRTLNGAAEIVAAGSELPAFDYHCPMLSLPLALETRLETVPAWNPYLHPDPTITARWRERLKDVRGLKIGLAWSGSAQNTNDRHRSLPLATLLEGLPHDAALFSLHKDITEADRATMAASGRLADWSQWHGSFAETAGLVPLLDLVLTVDTSIAHLAGALGARTWIMLSVLHDWRWLADRTDSPWYPTVRLFRQEHLGDWSTVLNAVARAIAELPTS